MQTTSTITIRPRDLTDDPTIVAIRNEANPHLPPSTVTDYRFGADPASVPEGAVAERFVADVEGQVAGLYVLIEEVEVERPNTFGANIGVAAASRNQGVGSALYAHMMERAILHGATRLYCQVSEHNHETFTFAEKRGFTKSGRAERMSRLDVAAANLDGYDGAVERVESGGLQIKTLADIGMDNEPFLRTLHRVSVESARDIPSSEQLTEFPYEIWLRFINSPGNSPDQIWVAVDGEAPVGLAIMGRRGENSAFNNYTGVSRSYRGRGIARALKLKTIEWARNTGIEYIFTGNDSSNKRMLSINIPLGYEAIPAQIQLVKDL